MKLLITTQVLDKTDPILGFFHRWVEEFAEHCEKVTVICLYEGVHALPANVEVLSLGKEEGKGRLVRLARFYKYIVGYRRQYDAVLVHMNPEYVVLGGLWWRLMGKRVALWYTHKSVTLALRLATLLAHRLFTASPESFRLKSSKLVVTGHGIDINLFAPGTHTPASPLHIFTAGRLAQTKHVHALLDAADLLRARGVPFELRIAGAPVTQTDTQYAESLYARAQSDTHFLGPKNQQEVAQELRRSSVFINLSATGSMDKAVLEALCAGVPAVSSNEAFKALLEPHGLFVASPTAPTLADAVLKASLTDVVPLSERVRSEHALAPLVMRLVKDLS